MQFWRATVTQIITPLAIETAESWNQKDVEIIGQKYKNEKSSLLLTTKKETIYLFQQQRHFQLDWKLISLIPK